MTDLIYSAVGSFTSVRDPYMTDKFVQGLFRPGGDTATARKRFATFLASRPLLPCLLSGIAAARDAEGAGDAPVPVIDCGVFMGNFSVAAALVGDQLGHAVTVGAYEANPALLDPIRANMDIYGLGGTVSVHANGIGGEYGTLKFTHAAGGLIGGTLFMADRKETAEGGHVTTDCAVIPLRDILADEQAPGLVKIDIEGNEVSAFGSIAGDAARLNNVFFIEFAPFQASLAIDGTTYGDFLLKHFTIYDAGSWLWCRQLRRLSDVEALKTCLSAVGSRAHNTDLLLVPHGMTALAAKVEALSAQLAAAA